MTTNTNNRVLKRILEEVNEYGNGFRMTIHVDQSPPLHKYVSLDAVCITDHEETEEGFGFIMSDNAAYDLAKALEKAAYEVRENQEEAALNG